MGTGTRLAGFALGLAVLFGVAYSVGAAVGNPLGDSGSSGGHPGSGHQHGSGAEDGGGHQHGGAAGAGGMDHPIGGLAIAENGYRLSRVSPDPVVGRPAELAFQVIGPAGRPVTSFVNTHDKPLHLIVARRDLSGFQHLHPAMDAGGTWRVPLVLGAAGDYRVFADFVPDNRLDTLVLGMDLAVPGDYRPAPPPSPAADAAADGYGVRMTRDGDLARFSITRNGAPVTDLQPYLGAYGHLVALRQGDLGYLHVHPEGGPGLSPPGPEITFGAALPPGGTYRLYLQFAHQGGVHTAEFTVHTTDAPG
jgi:hypothetical protein